MRMETPVPAPDSAVESPDKDRKSVHNASSKVNLVIQRMLFPLLESPMRTHVLLDAEADQLELDLMDQVGLHKPELVDDQQSFMQHIQSLLERYKRGSDRRGCYKSVAAGSVSQAGP